MAPAVRLTASYVGLYCLGARQLGFRRSCLGRWLKAAQPVEAALSAHRSERAAQ